MSIDWRDDLKVHMGTIKSALLSFKIRDYKNASILLSHIPNLGDLDRQESDHELLIGLIIEHAQELDLSFERLNQIQLNTAELTSIFYKWRKTDPSDVIIKERMTA